MTKSCQQPLVSILVPIYNVERYLEQCLSSIVSQSYDNLQIVCINDGSTDSSLEIIERFAANDPRIEIIDKPNSGYGASMNQGLRAAKGDYIGIVESDDYIEPKMFERLIGIAVEHNLDMAKCHFTAHIEGATKERAIKTKFTKYDEVVNPKEEWILFDLDPSIWCGLYKADMIRSNNIEFLESPGASFQDTSFAFKVLARSSRFMMIEDALLHYRINENSSIKSADKVYCVCDEHNEIKRFAEEHKILDELEGIIARIEHKGCRWNYNRLSKPKNMEFFAVWRDKLIERSNKGLLSGPTFTKREVRDFEQIISSPRYFIFRNNLKMTFRSLILNIRRLFV